LKGQTICESERPPERGRFHSSRQQILKFLRIKADGTLDRRKGAWGIGIDSNETNWIVKWLMKYGKSKFGCEHS